jgi:ubiquinone/menaquinone biosynthesis C-methylase UbiE
MRSKKLMSTYDTWSGFYDGFDNPLIPVEETAVHALLQTIACERVLDAAAGTGRYALALARQGKQVAAVDCNAKMLSKAQEKAAREGLQIEFRLDDLAALSFPDGTFDLVLCALALAHVKDLLGAYREFQRVLRPGGHLITSDLHPELQRQLGPRHRWELVAGEAPVFFPNYHASLDDYRSAMDRAGFQTRAVLELPLQIGERLTPGALVLWGCKPGTGA